MKNLDQDKLELELLKRIKGYEDEVRYTFHLAIDDLIVLAKRANVDKSKHFRFADCPAKIRDEANNIIRAMNSRIYNSIHRGMEGEWDVANGNNDRLVEALFGKRSLEKDHFARYFSWNKEAMDTLINRSRQEGGMGLSEKVWKYTKQFNSEMEMALDIGIGDGGSASQVSRSVRRLLKEPDKLFRRVRDKHGVLQLSKNALAYNPGQGVYRSSYKNAMRLTRTETNLAYHTSNHVRWQQLDFVVGFEVKLSNSHPEPDICNELKGRYPKAFKFVGWHPHCLCFVVSKLCNSEELSNLQDKLLSGEGSKEFSSTNEVKAVPTDFNKWIEENKPKAIKAKSIPYFIRDNFIDGDVTKGLKF